MNDAKKFIGIVLLAVTVLFVSPYVIAFARLVWTSWEGSKDWRTPIEFYGKAVDEKGQPVSGVKVEFGVNDTSAKGTSMYHTESDAAGLFSIRGIRGKYLGVSINKTGYYSSKENLPGFFYASGDNTNFVPSAASPVVFHLYKKGKAEPLAVIDGRGGYLIPRDGTPVEISLLTGKRTRLGEGDFRVECWTHDKEVAHGAKYDWKCRLTVPGGGILASSEEFNFQAPQDGYTESVEINMPVPLGKDWRRNSEGKFFVRLKSGQYGRFTFKMIAGGDHFFKVESFVNPSGSRNLEYDKALQIKP